jgi:hypothetical protein
VFPDCAAGTPCRRRNDQPREAQPLGLDLEQFLGQLNQDAGAVAGQRIGAHGAAMRQVVQNLDALGDDVVAFAVFDMRNEPDAACIVLMRRIVQTLLRSHTVRRQNLILPRSDRPWVASQDWIGNFILPHRIPLRRFRDVLCGSIAAGP